MGKINYPLKAKTFNQFKKRYTIFTFFFGCLLVFLFTIRGHSFNLWEKLSFQNNYQLLSILLIIFYIFFTFYIYYIFKRNYSTKKRKNKDN